MQSKNKNTPEFESKVVERHRKMVKDHEERTLEKEQKQMYDEHQAVFANSFESGELVS
tara:strand:- start:81 stop:254 length:174 start_codon:yes stop_codon:yes gene_type:complete